jgi:putative transposase
MPEACFQHDGRLMAMLEHVGDLTLAFLNEATQAWVEHEYNARIHAEIGVAPITRFLAGPEVTRPSPDSNALRLAFTRSATRTHRKSDGTIVIEGRRFEVPARYRHVERLEVRYAEWDLSIVHLVDERSGVVLGRLYPQDKTANASGLRRAIEDQPPWSVDAPPDTPIPPLLQRLLDAQSRTGLPPAYLPKHDRDEDGGRDDDFNGDGLDDGETS